MCGVEAIIAVLFGEKDGQGVAVEVEGAIDGIGGDEDEEQHEGADARLGDGAVEERLEKLGGGGIAEGVRIVFWHLGNALRSLLIISKLHLSYPRGLASYHNGITLLILHMYSFCLYCIIFSLWMNRFS